MGRLGTTVDVGLAVSMPVRRQHERRSSTTSALGATRRRHGEPMARLLTLMSSGVRFNENFPPGFTPDDTLQLILDTYARLGPGGVGAVTSFNDRERPAGTKFSYASVETLVLGLVLARATGNVARRQLGPGGHSLLPERRATRLRSARAPAGSRRQLAPPPDHPGRVGS
jgi:hypothetical protein